MKRVEATRWLGGLIAQSIQDEKPHSRWTTLFAEVKAVVEAVLRVHLPHTVVAFADARGAGLINGRAAVVSLSNGSVICRFGEVDPTALAEMSVDWPVAVFEISLSAVLAFRGDEVLRGT